MVIGINQTRKDKIERIAELLADETQNSKGMRKQVTRLQRRVERLEELMMTLTPAGVKRYNTDKEKIMVLGVSRKKQNPIERLTELLSDETKNMKGMRRDVTDLQARIERMEKIMKSFERSAVRRYDADN